MQSIQSMFTDVERRLVERLERVVERTTAQHVDAAALQFQDAIKRSREESAKRLVARARARGRDVHRSRRTA